MTELFLVILLGAGMTVLMWSTIGEIAILVRETAEDWINGLREETGTHPKADYLTHGPQRMVYDHIRLLLQITIGMGTERSIRAYVTISVFISVAVLILLIGRISFSLAVTAALGTGFLPYGILRLRLQKIRVESSREGEILITELLENYKIYYCNMQRAIEATAATIDEAPNSRRLLFNLARGLNMAEKNRIVFLLREFRLSINTSWGNILASNMGFALTSGVEVTEALTDLADTVKRARRVDEYARRENNEAAMMLKYLAPAAYLLTVAGGIGFFGLSPEKFFYYQFGTEAGLTWFTISLIIYGAGVILNGCISRTKLDI